MKPLDGPRYFFQVLSLFDWITPLKAMAEDVKEGGPINLDAWTFFIPMTKAVHSGWSQKRIKEFLTQNGIKTYSHLNFLDEYSFTVPLDQAAQAEHLLTIYGVPIHPRSQGAPRPKEDKQGPGLIETILDELF